jgi:hypothetical protein
MRGGGERDAARLVARVREPARDVGQEHELVGADRLGHGARGLVGVDVVRLPVHVGAHRRDHRYVVLREAPQQVHVHAVDLADVAEVHVVGRRHLADAEELAVVAADADRGLPVAVERQHDVLVLLADEHHLRDLDRGLVRDAQAAHELHVHAEPLHEARDHRAAAVHHDRVQAHVAQQHDVLREVVGEARVRHRRAADLDHDGLAVELADVRQGLEECPDAVVHVVYSALMVP